MRKIIFTIFIFQFSFLISNAQWTLQQSGVTYPLHDINFININTGWVCGDNGIILKTTNGGLNWVSQPNEAMGKYLYSIFPVNENILFCVGYFETILKTTNGGNNWITISNGPIGEGSSHLSVFFLNENTGWIGSTSFLLKTTNGGINWSEYLYNYWWFHDIYFKDSLNGIGVSGYSYYYGITSNGGVNWTPCISGEGNYYNISIMPYNKNIGFIVSTGGLSVRKTTNFGISFDSVGYIPNVPHELYCSKFINENTGWVGGSYGQLYKTENGGRTWRAQNSLNEAFVGKFYAFNDTTVWACGGGGKIIHTSNGGDTVTSINQISTNIPDKFELSQNYPNPFNNSTIIKFKIKTTDNYKLNIYDVSGKEIFILVSNKLVPGEYQFNFQSENLSSGIYFYKLESEKNIIVKKMILMK